MTTVVDITDTTLLWFRNNYYDSNGALRDRCSFTWINHEKGVIWITSINLSDLLPIPVWSLTEVILITRLTPGVHLSVSYLVISIEYA